MSYGPEPTQFKIFLDTASIKEVNEFSSWGIIDGVTTNQKIFLNEGAVDFKSRVLDICRAVNGPVSVETTTTGLTNLIEEAKSYAAWHENIVIKVAMFGNGDGLRVVHELTRQGIKTNMTVMMNLNQLLLASKAGATYVSLFYNRAKDAKEDPVKIIEQYAKTAREGKAARLIVGSIRSPDDVSTALAAGAHIVTVPPVHLRKMVMHPKTDETIKEFDDAWKRFTELSTK
jgi:transaldolase